jgi:hypothetical protein
MGEIYLMNKSQNKQANNIYAFGEPTIQNKFYEPKRVNHTYYGIGRDRDTNKEFVLDYQAKFRSEAEAYFDVEFNSMNADLIYVGVYQN